MIPVWPSGAGGFKVTNVRAGLLTSPSNVLLVPSTPMLVSKKKFTRGLDLKDSSR
jgi:hypothetical protein